MKPLAVLGGPSTLRPAIALVTCALSLAALPLLGGTLERLVPVAVAIVVVAAVQASVLALLGDRVRHARLRTSGRGLVAVACLAVIGAVGVAAVGWAAGAAGPGLGPLGDPTVWLIDGAAGWVIIGAIVTAALDRRRDMRASIVLARRGAALHRQRAADVAQSNRAHARQVISLVNASVVPELRAFLSEPDFDGRGTSPWVERLRALARGPVRDAAHALHPLMSMGETPPRGEFEPPADHWWRLPVLGVPLPGAWLVCAMLPGYVAFIATGASPAPLALSIAVIAGAMGILEIARRATRTPTLPPPAQWILLVVSLATAGAFAGLIASTSTHQRPADLALVESALLVIVGCLAASARAWRLQSTSMRDEAVRDYVGMHAVSTQVANAGSVRQAHAAQILHSFVQSRLLAAAGELALPAPRPVAARQAVETVLGADLPAVERALWGEASAFDWESGLYAAGVTTRGVDAVPNDLRPVVGAVVEEAVANARNHAHATAVEVRASLEEGHLVIEVFDNGSGFPPQQRPSLGFLLYDSACTSWRHERTADNRSRVRFEIPLPGAPS